MPERVRAIVVDDDRLYRDAARRVLESIPGIRVVGEACDGREGLALVRSLRPEIMTLDVLMPHLDGHDVLREMRRERARTKAIMLSSLTTEGAEATLRALALGAIDVVAKPSESSPTRSMTTLRAELVPRVEALRDAILSPPSARVAPPVPRRAAAPRRGSPKACVIGVSTGGPSALLEVIPRLPADLPTPVLIVQHMPATFTGLLARDLDRHSSLEVLEAEDGHQPTPGQVIVAKGDRHLRLEAGGPHGRLVLTDEEKLHSCRPAADILFESAAATHGGRLVGVLMTGMGDDGTSGFRALHAAGATLLAQSAETCAVWGMPRKPTEEGLVDHVVPLPRLAAAITRCCTGRGAARAA